MTKRAHMDDLVPTTGSVRLVSDPRSLEALGRNHTLEAAIAELVDNSVDAGAKHALVRFVRDGGRLVRLLVVDDGGGMSENHIDIAMTVGGSRQYRKGEIGRFGLGMKAASFSQARSVTVVSAAAGPRPRVAAGTSSRPRRTTHARSSTPRLQRLSSLTTGASPVIDGDPRPVGRRQGRSRRGERGGRGSVRSERVRQDSRPSRPYFPPSARAHGPPHSA